MWFVIFDDCDFLPVSFSSLENANTYYTSLKKLGYLHLSLKHYSL